MNLERVKNQLEAILDTSFHFTYVPLQDWPKQQEGLQDRHGELADWMEKNGALFFKLDVDGNQVRVLSAREGLVTESERKLIVLAMDAIRSLEKKLIRSASSDDEKLALNIRAWIEEQLRNDSPDGIEPSEPLTSLSALYVRRIPLLLYCDYSNNNSVDYNELKKLLDSFFDVEVLLIPLLEKEWLILGPDSLLTADLDEDVSEEECVEDALASLCSGLHTMMSNEWVGDYHVSSYYPIIPVKSLPSVVRKLREAINVGRMQRVGQYIHLPWQLYLDQLLSPIPLADKLKFIEQIFKRLDPFMDVETTQTLESFFELDCNVSETAKKLFIHRNTLLYRLDKFKQETGLDVRSFNQAIHVKIALQLYKVTKRK
jgi:hypothetical protein